MMERWDAKGCRVTEKMQQGVQRLHLNMGNHFNYLINTGFFWQSPPVDPLLGTSRMRPRYCCTTLFTRPLAGIAHRLSSFRGGGGLLGTQGQPCSPVAGESR